MRRLVVLGAGGHACVVADAAMASGDFDVVGFADDDPARLGTQALGISVVATIAETLAGEVDADLFIVAIGDNRMRSQVFAAGLERGLRPAIVVHPSAVVAGSASIGQGTLICAGAVVNPDTVVGENCIVNTRASVDHHGMVEAHVHLGPGVTLGGEVWVGEGALVGIGSTVMPRAAIGSWAQVGGGAVVVTSIDAGVTAVGVPAQPVST